MSIDLYNSGRPLGQVVVKNLLSKFTSSENLHTAGWAVTNGAVIDVTQENAITYTADAAAGVRVSIDNSILKGDFLTVSFDAWSPDISDDLLIKPQESVSSAQYTPTNGPYKITLSTTRTRYSLTVDTTGGVFPNVIGMFFTITASTTGTLFIDRVMIEKVTGRSNQNPSTYVPNSVSKQLNSTFNQPSTLDPGITISAGACALMDQTGWCWGVSALWTIASQTMTGQDIAGSLHSRQSSTSGRTYDYKYILSAQAMLSFSIGGTTLTTATDDAGASPGATGTHTGRLVAAGLQQLLVATQGAVVGSVFSEFSIIECDSETNVDGAAFRDSAGDLSVDGSGVVTE